MGPNNFWCYPFPLFSSNGRNQMKTKTEQESKQRRPFLPKTKLGYIDYSENKRSRSAKAIPKIDCGYYTNPVFGCSDLEREI